MSGLQVMQDRVALGDLIPGIEGQQGLNGAGWTGIERDDSVFDAGAKEECHVDGDHEAFPLAVGHFEIGQILEHRGRRACTCDFSMPSKSRAQASQAQRIWRVASSTR